MSLSRAAMAVAIALAVATLIDNIAFAHGNVTPQPIDASELKQLGKDWLSENPYRGDPKAIAIGASGYNQNCARCHGLQVISGGIAPDLRYLEKGKEGDEWFKERVTHGAIIDGMTKMPVFAGVISQEGLWAIRSYIESQHVDN